MKKREFLSKPLAFFVAIAFGALSFAGMYLLTASWPLGITTFFLAAVIEGEIFNQNISQAIAHFVKGPIRLIKRAMAERELTKLLEMNSTLQPSVLKEALQKRQYQKILQSLNPEMDAELRKFIELYFSKKTDQARLKKYQNTYDKAEFKANLKKTEVSIRDMEDFFITATTQPTNQHYETPLEKKLREAYAAQTAKLRNEIRNKKIALAISAICAIGTAIAQVLVAMASSQAAFVAIGLSVASSATIIGPIAVIAAVGYGLMMYYNVADMIQNDTVQRWARKTKEYFKRRTNDQGEFTESKARCIMRCTFAGIGVTFVLALAAFASISTAGTWWVAAKQGARMARWVSATVASIVSATTVFLMTPSLLAFNIFNSLTSMEGIFSKIKDKVNQRLGHDGHEHEPAPHRSFMQKLNPFRALYALASVVLRSIIFIGHLIAVGFTADQMPKVHPIITVIANAIAEGLQDYHYIFQNHTHGKPKADKQDINDDFEDAECGHHHTDISTWVLRIGFFPVVILARGWDYIFADRSAPKPPVVAETPKETFQKTATNEDFHSTWLKQVVIERCRHQEKALTSETSLIQSKALTKEKAKTFATMGYQLSHAEDKQDNSLTPVKTFTLFATNRNQLFKLNKPTASLKIMQEFVDDNLQAKPEFKAIENDLIRIGMARGASAA